MIAVTGTSGKTSVTAFTRQIWAKAGFAAASIGTTGVVAPGRNEYGTLTTPDPIALHLLLKELADSGVTHAAMEASSHGLDQRRLDGVKLKAGAFTNLGRDHLDYHPTIENYHAAKLRLFDTLLPKGAPAVIFADDVFSKATEAAAKDAGLDVRTVGRKGSFIALKRVEHERHRQRAEVSHDGVIYEIDLPLAGDFQIYNALVSAGLAISTGVAPADCFRGAGDAGRRAGAAGLCRFDQGWLPALRRLCAQAGGAGKCAGRRAAIHDGAGCRGVRLRRRPGQGQAAHHGRHCVAAGGRGDCHG